MMMLTKIMEQNEETKKKMEEQSIKMEEQSKKVEEQIDKIKEELWEKLEAKMENHVEKINKKQERLYKKIDTQESKIEQMDRIIISTNRELREVEETVKNGIQVNLCILEEENLKTEKVTEAIRRKNTTDRRRLEEKRK
ncbi:unnamed protein product [Psylliodes chrysocephalus]|uniref:Uncharacterized protein n=1 Tax=Psylliodes chrysocephalus TaxID=3402493 RepID=A0A9P0GCD7_9CUCU|nr:unnamed protein product [Psylliodes chrysocephala]